MINEGQVYYYKANGEQRTVSNVNGNIIVMNDGNMFKVEKFFKYFSDSYQPGINESMNTNYNNNNIYNDYIQNTSNNIPSNDMSNDNFNNMKYNKNISYSSYNSPQTPNNINENNNYSNNEMNQNHFDDSSTMGPRKASITIIDEAMASDPIPAGQSSNDVILKTIKPKNYIPDVNFTNDNSNMDVSFDTSGMTPEEIEAYNKYNGKGTKNNSYSPPNNEYTPNHHSNMISNISDPAKQFLSKVKRNFEIQFKFELTTLIPNLEYLKMSQENLDVDLLEALAHELVDNFYRDKETIKDTILQQLRGNGLEEAFKNAKKVDNIKKAEKKPIKKRNSKSNIDIESSTIEVKKLNKKSILEEIVEEFEPIPVEENN